MVYVNNLSRYSPDSDVRVLTSLPDVEMEVLADTAGVVLGDTGLKNLQIF